MLFKHFTPLKIISNINRKQYHSVISIIQCSSNSKGIYLINVVKKICSCLNNINVELFGLSIIFYQREKSYQVAQILKIAAVRLSLIKQNMKKALSLQEMRDILLVIFPVFQNNGYLRNIQHS
ncbi:unnamed protein product [Paramecium octaurelia]|uniref:Uncharacterized protein n=1 Tax=Paramecium octaurelia TaxID=43137 RepID=A0A8S1TNT6_PAROT|nr:unnamed protein product [Paramecium octaurelia]